MRVLLVEDTDPLRHLFARLLKSRGIDVREAADGSEALASLSDFTPDMVLTDLMMPVMDGYELIRRVRAMPTFAAVPVVAMTAATTAEAEQRARAAGAMAVIAKPIESPGLVERLRSLLP